MGIMCQGGTGTHNPAERVEDLAEIMLPLRGVLEHEREVGNDKISFVILDVSWIGLPCHADTSAQSGESP